MSYWDADAQRWVEGPSGAGGAWGPDQPPPDDGLRRMLIVVFAAVVLAAAAVTGIWWLARDHGGGPHRESPFFPPPAVSTLTPGTPDTTDTADPVFPGITEPEATATTGTAGTAGATETGEPAAGPAPSTATATRPESTVTTYYAALNSGDYTTAWAFGGKNLSPSYTEYVAGFSDTRRTGVTVLSATGDTVRVDITSSLTDGTRQTYSGTYTVHDGVITDARISRVS
ncbi:hypothetical protein [Streptomyces sp. YS-3]|uniref:hypothetical protein n=1 Tax=Streptomyces sp. YS-3 TaxID=3381352 RepID=UPI003862D011